MNDTSRAEFERLSAMLSSCPLCGDKDVQLNAHPEIKPDANCNNCGISYQGQTVEEVIDGWNVTLLKGMMNVEGIKAVHAIITDECRTNRGSAIALEEAFRRVRCEYLPLIDLHQIGRGTKFHIVLSVEQPETADSQICLGSTEGEPDSVAVIQEVRRAIEREIKEKKQMSNEIPKSEEGTTKNKYAPGVTMNPVTRCKVKVLNVADQNDVDGQKFAENVMVGAVYSDDPESENRQWSIMTPAFNLSMTINNPGAFGRLKAGMEYYVDFTPVAD